MNENGDNVVQKCTMCFFTTNSNDALIQHIVRYHRHDPRFSVQCTQPGCGTTYDKWKSFLQHLARKHRTSITTGNNIDILEYLNGMQDILNEELSDTTERSEPNAGDSILSPEKLIQWYAAKFILNIRENCKIAQTAMEQIIDGVTSLLEVYSSIVITDLQRLKNPETQMVHFDDIKRTFTEVYPPTMIFSTLNTEKSLNNFLVNEMGMIAPIEVTICKNKVWRKKKGPHGKVIDLHEVNCNAYIIPFMSNLENLLLNEEVRSNIENPSNYQSGIYRTVLDGNYYQENTFFKENENALAIILYYDDLGITNPGSSSSKIQKLSMFYWTLANIKPELRSSTNTIQLLAIVKTQYLKKPKALEKILGPFIDDIVELQTNGLNMTVNGIEKNYKGSLLFISGDTPASAFLGGFKESVAANRPCRSCMIIKSDIPNHSNKNNLTLRDLINHNDQLSAIEEPNLSRTAKQFCQKTYGINSRSPLMQIPHFDTTKCLPQDCMNVLIEGVTEITCRRFLWYCILEKEIFSINEFNKQLATFDFGDLSRDKPGEIDRSDFAVNKPLRQSAAQMLVLAHTLLFIIDELILDHEDEDLVQRIDHYVLLLQIMNLSLAYEITEESIEVLTRIIEIFILKYVILYPDIMVPKFHFLIHVPDYIKRFGPGRQQWCFRFESAHAYYKSMVSVVRNFKNMPYTMASRHQARLCSRLSSHPGQSSKTFLYGGDKIAAGPTILASNSPHVELLNSYIEESERATYLVMQSPKVVIYGTVYKKKSIVLVQCEEDSMPVFGQLNDICIIGDKILLIVTLLKTIQYESRLNAYKIIKPQNNCGNRVIDVKNLIFPHLISSFSLRNARFIPLMNCQRCEFTG